ncbi:MAG: hypothetical protein ACE5H0_02760 [Bacteroidota bacterium]
MQSQFGRYSLIVLVLGTAASFGQTSADEPTGEYGRAGISQYGFSGLFVTPSPAVLGQGEVGGGIFYNGEFGAGQLIGAFPVALAFGLAKGVDAYASFASVRWDAGDEENYSTLGLKVNFFHHGPADGLLSGCLQMQRVELRPASTSIQEVMAFSGTLIASSPLWRGTIGYLHLGYTWVEDKLPSVRSRIVGGSGVTVPLAEHLLAVGELYTGEQLVGKGAGVKLGLKWFLVQHFQLAMGVQGSRREGRGTSGVFFGLSFSSEVLRASRESGGEPPRLFPEPPPLEELSSPNSASAASFELP